MKLTLKVVLRKSHSSVQEVGTAYLTTLSLDEILHKIVQIIFMPKISLLELRLFETRLRFLVMIKSKGVMFMCLRALQMIRGQLLAISDSLVSACRCII
jgi:hypothetical protein